MQRKFRPTIWANWTKKDGKPKVISITDNLCIGKVQFSGSESGTDSVRAYISQTKALALANAILSGNFSKIYAHNSTYGGMTTTGRFVVYGGSAKSSMYAGKPESRVVQIEQVADKDNKGNTRVRYKIEVRVGEGTLGDNGQIMPKDNSNMIKQFMFLPLETAYEMASMLKMHIEAYYSHYMEFMYDENGNPKKTESIDDFYKAEFRGGNDDVSSTGLLEDDEIPLV